MGSGTSCVLHGYCQNYIDDPNSNVYVPGPEIEVKVPGVYCHENSADIIKVNGSAQKSGINMDQCWKDCQATSDCKYISHHQDGICSLHKLCQNSDYKQAVGWNIYAEIIETKEEGKRCFDTSYLISNEGLGKTK